MCTPPSTSSSRSSSPSPRAVRPATRAATPELFGRPVIGTTVDGGDSQNIYGSRFTTGIRAGAVASISVFVASPVDEAPHDRFELAIYHDSGGAPGHLLATTASGRLVPDSWNTLPDPSRARAEDELLVDVQLQRNERRRQQHHLHPGRRQPARHRDPVASAGSPLATGGPDPCGRSDETDGGRDPRHLARGENTAARRDCPARGVCRSLLIAWMVRRVLSDPYLYPRARIPRHLRGRRLLLRCDLASRPTRRGLFVALIALTTVRTGGHYSEEVIGGVLLGWAMATAAKAFAGDVTGAPSQGVIDITDGSARRPESGADRLASTGGDVVIERHPD